VLLGTLPIALGFSFWQAVLATVCGVLLGTIFTHADGAVRPGPARTTPCIRRLLRVRGRIIGSFLSLLTAVAFTASIVGHRWE
jgi:purine-cytosine permease-like protein